MHPSIGDLAMSSAADGDETVIIGDPPEAAYSTSPGCLHGVAELHVVGYASYDVMRDSPDCALDVVRRMVELR